MKARNPQRAELIERYLNGRLTAAEEAAFEEAYLGDPELLDELELADKLKEGLARHGRQEPAASRPAQARPAWLRFVTSPQYAVAATALLAVSFVSSSWLAVQYASLRDAAPGETRLAENAPTRMFQLLLTRGAGELNVIELPAEDEFMVFLADPGADTYDSYSATLSRIAPDGRTAVWRASDLEPWYESLSLGVPSRVLGPGEYEIEVFGRMDDWPADRSDSLTVTSFRLVAPAP